MSVTIEGTNCVDLIDSRSTICSFAKERIDQVGVNKDGDVFLMGYSHWGGYYYLLRTNMTDVKKHFSAIKSRILGYCSERKVYVVPASIFNMNDFTQQGYLKKNIALDELTPESIAAFYEDCLCHNLFPEQEELKRITKRNTEYNEQQTRWR